jgi:hypothetical protein
MKSNSASFLPIANESQLSKEDFETFITAIHSSSIDDIRKFRLLLLKYIKYETRGVASNSGASISRCKLLMIQRWKRIAENNLLTELFSKKIYQQIEQDLKNKCHQIIMLYRNREDWDNLFEVLEDNPHDFTPSPSFVNHLQIPAYLATGTIRRENPPQTQMLAELAQGIAYTKNNRWHAAADVLNVGIQKISTLLFPGDKIESTLISLKKYLVLNHLALAEEYLASNKLGAACREAIAMLQLYEEIFHITFSKQERQKLQKFQATFTIIYERYFKELLENSEYSDLIALLQILEIISNKGYMPSTLKLQMKKYMACFIYKLGCDLISIQHYIQAETCLRGALNLFIEITRYEPDNAALLKDLSICYVRLTDVLLTLSINWQEQGGMFATIEKLAETFEIAKHINVLFHQDLQTTAIQKTLLCFDQAVNRYFNQANSLLELFLLANNVLSVGNNLRTYTNTICYTWVLQYAYTFYQPQNQLQLLALLKYIVDQSGFKRLSIDSAETVNYATTILLQFEKFENSGLPCEIKSLNLIKKIALRVNFDRCLQLQNTFENIELKLKLLKSSYKIYLSLPIAEMSPWDSQAENNIQCNLQAIEDWVRSLIDTELKYLKRSLRFSYELFHFSENNVKISCKSQLIMMTTKISMLLNHMSHDQIVKVLNDIRAILVITRDESTYKKSLTKICSCLNILNYLQEPILSWEKLLTEKDFFAEVALPDAPSLTAFPERKMAI